MCRPTTAEAGATTTTPASSSPSPVAPKNDSESSSSTWWKWLVLWLRFPMCAGGICVAYLYYGIFQERLFTNPTERLGASFVLVTSCITNVGVAILWNTIQTKWLSATMTTAAETRTTTTTTKAALNHKLLVITSACYIGAMVGSNEAVPYVSYPVAVLAKSCKLIPIMLVGQFVEKKLYSSLEWTAALFISLGIVTFQFSRMSSSSSTTDSSHQVVSPQEQTFGMGLLLVSLILDGLLSSCQNLLKTKSDFYRVPNAVETMLYVNLYALLFIIPWTWYTGQWEEAQIMFREHPKLVHKLATINAVVACGQVFIFLTITWYSSVVTTTITTTRKFFTILLSVHTFGHVFNALQWTSISMVFCGLYLAIVAQQQKQKQPKHTATTVETTLMPDQSQRIKQE